MKALNTLIFTLLFGGVSAQVGIGTTTPSNDLDVEGSGAAATAVDINNTSTGDPKINLQVGGTTTFSIGIDNSDADKLKIGTSALETNTRLTIDASGNVGIGTTTPTAALTVNGNISLPASSTEGRNLEIGTGRTGNGFAFIDFIGDATYTDYGLRIMRNNFGENADANIINRGTGILAITAFDAGSIDLKTTNTARLSITSEGLVGIGTSSPSEILDIQSSDATKTAVDINNTGGGDPKINLQVGGTTKFSIGVDNSDSDKLKIGTSALETNTRLTIDASGNVGIGTSSPSTKLEILGDDYYVATTSNTAGTWSGTEVIGARMGVTYSTGELEFRRWTGTNADHHNFLIAQEFNGAYYTLVFKGNVLSSNTKATTNIMALNPFNGYVGIGTITPSYLLSVNGRPGANGYTAFTNYSDSRLKTNVTSLDTGALHKILQLRPVQFQYNDKYLQLYPNSDLNKVHKGFIAQEIQQVFPEMVSEMKESPDSVKYLDLDVSHLQVYLVKALQEQQAIIEAQKKENESQKAEIDALKESALKVVELENKMNAMLLLLNNKTEVTAKQ